MLLTGKEAQLASSDQGWRLRALRFGSSSERALELQDKLVALPEGAGVTRTGVFDWKTLGGVLRGKRKTSCHQAASLLRRRPQASIELVMIGRSELMPRLVDLIERARAAGPAA